MYVFLFRLKFYRIHNDCLHEDIHTIPHRCKLRWDPVMMGDSCWFLLSENDPTSDKGKECHQERHYTILKITLLLLTVRVIMKHFRACIRL